MARDGLSPPTSIRTVQMKIAIPSFVVNSIEQPVIDLGLTWEIHDLASFIDQVTPGDTGWKVASTGRAGQRAA